MKTSNPTLTALAWLYLACMGAATALMYALGDRWWPATLLLFGPRWVLGLPLIPLLPLALFRKRLLLIPLGLSLGVFLWPLLGWNVVWDSPKSASGATVRVLSLNTKDGHIDRDALAGLITGLGVDVVALQELPKWYTLPFIPGWHTLKQAGVAIYSRYPLVPAKSVWTTHPPHLNKQLSGLGAVVDAPQGRFAFFAVHLPSARYGLQNVVSRGLGVDPGKAGMLRGETSGRELASRRVADLVGAASLPVIVAGDFNMPRQSRIFRDVWGRYHDAFAETAGGYGWTFYDEYRGIPVPLSIDHVVTGNGALPLDFSVGPDIYSDHRPIIADVALPPAK
ncbi:Endonuclease/Exonuclease/phosphatase family protein [Pseudodesulfovibrio hydrargyri]|uniref:Endonuclease/Exonuclease/phosphatase family protein n=1 Tax=Pseudodesulfovibrio hydrargyri TaxID=2125990 RepID=A0A1J5MSC6_9BACT|nr:endonuclease/exonuclease/phosphatase family protein [Pseudodesulfovibrio hydrargyri]OIQ49501.1 Endonuclease/Exonuclease/phosphatase family protein [Pseudodesulfovibrio hydrargyri]